MAQKKEVRIIAIFGGSINTLHKTGFNQYVISLIQSWLSVPLFIHCVKGKWMIWMLRLRQWSRYELGRQPANTKLSSNVTVRRVRVRGGNFKFRALRLDSGNFAWGSEVCFQGLLSRPASALWPSASNPVCWAYLSPSGTHIDCSFSVVSCTHVDWNFFVVWDGHIWT